MKMDRKKFFLFSSTTVLGLTLLKSFPFNLFSKKNKYTNGKLKVRINPSAVSRSSKEGSNG